uniref:RNA helicase n=1 Tax=Eutreptiella gymnastica TaxID=73025 RepID=A0A7S1N3Q4_9EUGL
MALEAGYRAIACTQPRKVAAITVSQRVAQERGAHLGSEVGYSVRFDNKTSGRPRLRYMTDGVLLQECMSHPQFDQYDVVFIDEVHERTLATDILLGLLKQVTANSQALKVVIMSATFDCVKFSDFFAGAPTVHVPGSTYPVQILNIQHKVDDYLDQAIATVYNILLFEEDQGHILVFLTGEEEIEQACDILRVDPRFHGDPGLVVLPLYSALPPQDQIRVFEGRPGQRKCIFATNIAETSVTIPGVVYVVDCGFSKQKMYLPRSRVETLLIQPISQASARQRAGRAGRTRPGKCFRLYHESVHDQMEDASTPEILRSDMSQVILQLSKLGVANLMQFPFVDAPRADVIIRSLEHLQQLRAIGQDLRITDLGRQVSHFPVEPSLAVALLLAHHEGCTKQIATIVGMLSVPKLYMKSDRESEGHSDRARSLFKVRDGDHLTLLKTFTYYLHACTGDVNGELDARVAQNGCRAGRDFCHKHRISERGIRQAASIRSQLLQILQRLGLPTPGLQVYDYDDWGYSEAVRRALCRGMFMNIACLVDYEYIQLVHGNNMRLHPSTVLKGEDEWIIYHEAVITKESYLRVCSKVQLCWLQEFAPDFIQALRCSQHLDKKQKSKIFP